MNDDLTPPDEHLDAVAKSRIRQQVIAGLDEPRAAGRWAVPLAAAAAVAIVAGLVGYVALRSDPATEAVGDPAGSTSQAPSPAPSAAEEPSDSAPDEPDAERTLGHQDDRGR